MGDIERIEGYLAGNESRTAFKAVIDEQTHALREAKRHLARAEGALKFSE